MNIKSSNPSYHILYIILVFLVLTLVFGHSWGNSMAAFYFVSMLLPIVLGTSYFFNYFLVPHYYMKKRFVRFGFYTFYTMVVSIYLEMIVLLFAFVYLVNFRFSKIGPNASDTILLAVILYLLVFLGSLLLMARQIKEKQQLISELMADKEKMEKPFLEIMSNRKKVKVPFDEILFIESLSDYIKVHTVKEEITSKEKISNIDERLPEMFLRIHRSFIVNKQRINNFTYNEIVIGDTSLNIGRSYKKTVRESLQK
ncbi:MAG: LytTR family transcriptional regulator DNA-binding domain-containing protein [Bacteroidales bacterium]|nr:LytTR family transcriptional regulator DNA-binding domain-containing protein [Bacteroidales bacterium]